MRTKIEGNYAVTLKGIIVACFPGIFDEQRGGGGQGEFISPPNSTQQLGCIRCIVTLTFVKIILHPGACIIEGIPISFDK